MRDFSNLNTGPDATLEQLIASRDFCLEGSGRDREWEAAALTKRIDALQRAASEAECEQVEQRNAVFRKEIARQDGDEELKAAGALVAKISDEMMAAGCAAITAAEHEFKDRSYAAHCAYFEALAKATGSDAVQVAAASTAYVYAALDLAALRRAALEKRIAALEAKTVELRYLGTWEFGRKYAVGNFVTQGGSVWHCNRADTKSRPGDGPDWTLAVKAGRDAR